MKSALHPLALFTILSLLLVSAGAEARTPPQSGLTGVGIDPSLEGFDPEADAQRAADEEADRAAVEAAVKKGRGRGQAELEQKIIRGVKTGGRKVLRTLDNAFPAGTETEFPPVGPLEHNVLAVNCEGLEGVGALRKIDRYLSAADAAIDNLQITAAAYSKKGCPKLHDQNPKVHAEVMALYKAAAADMNAWEEAVAPIGKYGRALADGLGEVSGSKLFPKAADCQKKIEVLVGMTPKLKTDLTKALTCGNPYSIKEIYKRFKYDW